MSANPFRDLVVLCHAIFCTSLVLASVSGAQTLFTDVTEQSGLHAFGGQSSRDAVFADFDNDGLQDVLLTDQVPPYTPRRIGLFHNSGDGRFDDQTFLVPPDLHAVPGRAGAIFGDCDNDGDEDLFLPVYPHNVLLRNDRGLLTRAPHRPLVSTALPGSEEARRGVVPETTTRPLFTI